MKIEILTTPNCTNCDVLKKMLDELGLPYKVIDVTEKTEYLQKYQTFMAPALVLDDKLEFTGIPKKVDLLKKLKI